MRTAFSIVEALLAATILALLVVAIQGVAIQSTRGVAVDRATLARRHMVHDLLERYGHAAADVAALFPPGTQPPATRQLSVPEAVAAVGLPASSAALVSETLASAGVTHFQLVWTPGVLRGAGDPARAVRLDRLGCSAVLDPREAGPVAIGFRLFMVRGAR